MDTAAWQTPAFGDRLSQKGAAKLQVRPQVQQLVNREVPSRARGKGDLLPARSLWTLIQ